MSDNLPCSSPASRKAMAVLLEAYHFAKDVNVPPRDFAVRIEELQRSGVSEVELRWLCAKGYAQHLIDTTLPYDRKRRFRVSNRSGLGTRSCFIMTDVGASFASSFRDTPHRLNRTADVTAARGNEEALDVPQWDAGSRELRVGRVLVKRFRQRASSQQMILAVFEEEGWPHAIDDPLPPKADVDSRARLHDAIKRLNQHQKKQLIHFQGDGTGQRVMWEWSHDRQ